MAAHGKAWLAALALLFTGCIGATNPAGLDAANAPQLPPPPNPIVFGEGHDHAEAAAHAMGSANLQPLSHVVWDKLLLGKLPAHQFGEVDVYEDTAFVAALMAGFAIVDISDPADLETLSYTAIPPVYVADIKAAEQGNLAILGTQRSLGRLASALGVPVGIPALPTGMPLEAPIGLIGLQAWDTSDKANPVFAGYLYVDRGCHMVSVREYGSDTYVFCAPNDNSVRIFKVVRAGPAVVFQLAGIWSPGDVTEIVNYKVNPLGGQFVHDMTVQEDPITGEPVMFVSFWDLGVFAVDVKDPASPATLGSWSGADALLWGGHLHTAMSTVLGGKRVVITIPEYAAIPAVFILDATDYGAMRLLSEWQPRDDGDYGENSALFSTHNFQVVGTKMYLGMYHGGVWVLDLSDPAAPRPFANFLPHDAEGTDWAQGGSPVPNTWDVVVANGHILAVDIPTGLYVLHLDGDPGGDAEHDSFA